MAVKVKAASAVSMAESQRHARLEAVRDARRSGNRVRRLHHHAVRTDDMEATRCFYEDLLGMPMVGAFKENTGRHTGDEAPFLHCFFELADGISLAFFQFAPGTQDPANKLPADGIDHHIAVSVPDADDIVRLKARFDELGYLNCGINHGSCYSLYVCDPNGMLLELTSDAAHALEQTEAAAASAHEVLAEWNSGDYASDDDEGVPMAFPLSTSPAEEIAKVIRGDSATIVRSEDR